MSDIANEHCEACTKLTPRLSADQVMELLGQLPVPGWSTNGQAIRKCWEFTGFAKPKAAVDAICVLAEEQRHHPDIRFGWGFVEVTISTHAIHGLSRNDFILAAKIDAIAP